MKKIIKHHLDSFRKKDLKRYSKVINQYFKRKFRFVFFLAFASCSVQNQMDKEGFQKIPNQMTAEFYDKLDTIKYDCDDKFFTRSFIKVFSDKKDIDYSKPINLNIFKDTIYLKFGDTSNKEYVLKFQGKHRKKKFIFYTNYQTVSFPLLFITKYMVKYTIYFPSENEIIFQNHYVSEGMVLFFGAGSDSKNNYAFKILRHE